MTEAIGGKRLNFKKMEKGKRKLVIISKNVMPLP